MQMPAFPSVRHARRAAALFISLFFFLQLGGCSYFRPAPLAIPAGFAQRPEAAGLLNPASRQAAYQALFPKLETIWAGGTLSASTRLRRGKEIVDYVYFSRNDAGASDHLLRMRGGRGPLTVFDLIVRGRYATVIVLAKRPDGMNYHLVFQGDIPAEGSPLADRFGVEPWDLVPIFTIGQQVAAGQFTARVERRETTLKPVDAKGALKEVELENLSGLPRRAEWELGGKRYEVLYKSWDFYTDPLNKTVTRLMPSKMEVRRRGLTLNLSMRAYHYDQQFTPKMFEVVVDQNSQVYPLEKLKNIF